MPIYEYVCSDCESKFELLRPFSQASEGASCPHCQKSAERILSTFACFSTDESGMTSMVGGNSCASCGSDSCNTCAM
ncbi:FmdB family zinc ribbon protein [Chloroflexota bacterium]